MIVICASHWQQMLNKLKELGIDHIGARTAQEALARVEAQERRGIDIPVPDCEWDPLLGMTSIFIRYAITAITRVQIEPAQECPLCVVRADFDLHNTPEGRCGAAECPLQLMPGEDPWDIQYIDTCAELMRVEAVKRRLVKVS